MDDYKAMYYTLFCETQKAIEILKKAQIDCEELFLAQGEEDDKTIS